MCCNNTNSTVRFKGSCWKTCTHWYRDHIKSLIGAPLTIKVMRIPVEMRSNNITVHLSPLSLKLKFTLAELCVHSQCVFLSYLLGLRAYFFSCAVQAILTYICANFILTLFFPAHSPHVNFWWRLIVDVGYHPSLIKCSSCKDLFHLSSNVLLETWNGLTWAGRTSLQHAGISRHGSECVTERHNNTASKHRCDCMQVYKLCSTCITSCIQGDSK